MKQIKTFAVAMLLLFSISSCSNDNEDSTPAIRDYATQYNEDIVKIENYLKTHSVTVVENSGFSDDQNVTFNDVTTLSSESIWGSDPVTPKASVLSKVVTIGTVAHKIYYLKFREGTGANPGINNQIKASYKGLLLNNTVFDSSPTTGSTFPLNALIIGWREILPLFKMGTVIGENQYEDFGAGVMFLPSAVGYYNNSPAQSVPAYSPLIFSFKLYNVL